MSDIDLGVVIKLDTLPGVPTPSVSGTVLEWTGVADVYTWGAGGGGGSGDWVGLTDTVGAITPGEFVIGVAGSPNSLDFSSDPIVGSDTGTQTIDGALVVGDSGNNWLRLRPGSGTTSNLYFDDAGNLARMWMQHADATGRFLMRLRDASYNSVQEWRMEEGATSPLYSPDATTFYNVHRDTDASIWDMTNDTLGIGTLTPTGMLSILGDNVNATFDMHTVDSVPAARSSRIRLYRAQGTPGAEAAVADADGLADIMIGGHDGTDYQTTARFKWTASEPFTATERGTALTYSSVPDLATAEVEHFQINGTGLFDHGVNGLGAYTDITDAGVGTGGHGNVGCNGIEVLDTLTLAPTTGEFTGVIRSAGTHAFHGFSPDLARPQIFVGPGCGNFSMTSAAGSNAALGLGCLASVSTGSQNLALGGNALAALTTADNVLGIGFGALNDHTTGDNVIAIGPNCLPVSLTVTKSVAIGEQVGLVLTSGTGLMLIGPGCAINATGGSTSVGLGEDSLRFIHDLSAMTAIGSRSLRGYDGVSPGDGPDDNPVSTVAIGTWAAQSINGGFGVFVGQQSGTYVGSTGYNAHSYTCIGYDAGGHSSLTSGNRMTFIGRGAGGPTTNQANFTNRCLVIGVDAYATQQRQIAIGNNAFGLKIGDIVIGERAAARLCGFQTHDPLYVVDVQGNLRIADENSLLLGGHGDFDNAATATVAPEIEITPGATGSGRLTIAGVNGTNGNDEDLVFDFDGAANEVELTSGTGVTKLDLSMALDIGGAVTIDGAVTLNDATAAVTSYFVGDEAVVLVDTATAGGDVTVRPPAVASAAGRYLRIVNIDSNGAANHWIFNPNAAELINGASTLVGADADYDSVTVYCDGSEWYIVN